MLIGWGTPFNVRSAIGKFSRAVAEELRKRGHEPVILRLESGAELELDALETDLPVVSADKADLASFDELVVNFGNHAPYHAQCVSVVSRRAPLGIFHDAEMRDFEWGLRDRHGFDLPRLHGLEDDELHRNSDELIGPATAQLLGTLAATCWGAIIHGPHYRRTVEGFCPGPVEIVPLCYPDPGVRRDPPPAGKDRRVIIFGVINEHKQPRRTMAAIALLKRRVGPIELHLAGAIEDNYRSRLVDEAKKLGIDPPVVHGFVSDERLQALIEQANAVCCLRYPVTEGGSASLATALYRQRPLIVADVASYSLVPDNLAHKVSYGEEPKDLADALAEIFDDPEKAERRASKARDWAEKAFSAKTYVDALLPVLEGNGRPARLASLARSLVPAITDPQGRPMIRVVPEFAEVLDWMAATQGEPNAAK